MSPDGRTFIYTRANSPARSRRSAGRCSRSASTAPATTRWHRGTRRRHDAIFSPDGTILFRSFEDDESKQSDYWTVRPDGTGLNN